MIGSFGRKVFSVKVRDEVVEEFLCAKAGKGDVELGRRGAKRWQVGGVKSDPSCRCRQEDVNVGSVRSCSRGSSGHHVWVLSCMFHEETSYLKSVESRRLLEDRGRVGNR